MRNVYDWSLAGGKVGYREGGEGNDHREHGDLEIILVCFCLFCAKPRITCLCVARRQAQMSTDFKLNNVSLDAFLLRALGALPSLRCLAIFARVYSKSCPSMFNSLSFPFLIPNS